MIIAPILNSKKGPAYFHASLSLVTSIRQEEK